MHKSIISSDNHIMFHDIDQSMNDFNWIEIVWSKKAIWKSYESIGGCNIEWAGGWSIVNRPK